MLSAILRGPLIALAAGVLLGCSPAAQPHAPRNATHEGPAGLTREQAPFSCQSWCTASSEPWQLELHEAARQSASGGELGAAEWEQFASESSRVATSCREDCGLQCGRMTVTVFDVGQALAALVVLPDGRRILVDAGEDPKRAGCGQPCRDWHEHLLNALRARVPDNKIDLLWITHQHSDHHGGAVAVLEEFRVETLVDNGTALNKRLVKKVRAVAKKRGTRVVVVDPAHPSSPLPGTAAVKLTPVVPQPWPANCEKHPNDCSIGLRIDHCNSSVLFVGDAEAREESQLKPLAPVNLLQVGHHGSATSSSEEFLKQTLPRALQRQVAVISSAEPGKGTNRTYCHPRAGTVSRLTEHLGPPYRALNAFAGVKCSSEGWEGVQASTRLRFTVSDGDVSLTSTGDGEFVPDDG